MKQASEILLITKRGTLLMQHRDDKPTIKNPGMITGFGGRMEGDESRLEGAARELHEETNVSFTPDQLEYFKSYQKVMELDDDDSLVHFFLLRDVPSEGLEVYEGQGFLEVSPTDDLDSIPLSRLAKQAALDCFAFIT